MNKEPIHKNDCERCHYLDTITDEDYTYDLYFCTQGRDNPRFHTVIARYGEYGDYISGLDFADEDPPLKRAKELAEEKGYL
jgi:hypothetical protein